MIIFVVPVGDVKMDLIDAKCIFENSHNSDLRFICNNKL